MKRQTSLLLVGVGALLVLLVPAAVNAIQYGEYVFQKGDELRHFASANLLIREGTGLLSSSAIPGSVDAYPPGMATLIGSVEVLAGVDSTTAHAIFLVVPGVLLTVLVYLAMAAYLTRNRYGLALLGLLLVVSMGIVDFSSTGVSIGVAASPYVGPRRIALATTILVVILLASQPGRSIGPSGDRTAGLVLLLTAIGLLHADTFVLALLLVLAIIVWNLFTRGAEEGRRYLLAGVIPLVLSGGFLFLVYSWLLAGLGGLDVASVLPGATRTAEDHLPLLLLGASAFLVVAGLFGHKLSNRLSSPRNRVALLGAFLFVVYAGLVVSTTSVALRGDSTGVQDVFGLYKIYTPFWFSLAFPAGAIGLYAAFFGVFNAGVVVIAVMSRTTTSSRSLQPGVVFGFVVIFATASAFLIGIRVFSEDLGQHLTFLLTLILPMGLLGIGRTAAGVWTNVVSRIGTPRSTNEEIEAQISRVLALAVTAMLCSTVLVSSAVAYRIEPVSADADIAKTELFGVNEGHIFVTNEMLEMIDSLPGSCGIASTSLASEVIRAMTNKPAPGGTVFSIASGFGPVLMTYKNLGNILSLSEIHASSRALGICYLVVSYSDLVSETKDVSLTLLRRFYSPDFELPLESYRRSTILEPVYQNSYGEALYRIRSD